MEAEAVRVIILHSLLLELCHLHSGKNSFPRGDIFSAASHNTPSEIEQREFCDVILDYVTKSAALKISYTLPSRSGNALCR